MHYSHSFTLATAVLSAIRAVNSYTLVSTFDSTNFFDEFGFFTASDPTLGYVEYVGESTAQTDDLIKYENNQVYLGVDSTTNNPSGGRESVRLTSNQAYSTLPPLFQEPKANNS